MQRGERKVTTVRWGHLCDDTATVLPAWEPLIQSRWAQHHHPLRRATGLLLTRDAPGSSLHPSLGPDSEPPDCAYLCTQRCLSQAPGSAACCLTPVRARGMEPALPGTPLATAVGPLLGEPLASEAEALSPCQGRERETPSPPDAAELVQGDIIWAGMAGRWWFTPHSCVPLSNSRA